MEAVQLVSSITIGLISVLLLTYSFFTSKEKGPILSNTYLFATAKERKEINKSAEYRLVTIVFRILGMIFLLLAIRIITSWVWISYIIGILIVTVIIYAVIVSVKSERHN